MATIADVLAERRRLTKAGTDPTVATRAQAFRLPSGSDGLPPPPGTDTGTTTHRPPAFGETREGIIFADEQERARIEQERKNREALARQQHEDALVRQQREQEFEQAQLDRRLAAEGTIRAEERERQRQASISQLRIERQETFASLMKSGDQARAVIFALGFGPLNDIFDTRAQSLGTTVKELAGAKELQRTTQSALSRVLDRDVTIGGQGVRGLGTAISSARAFIQGGADVQSLITSAFGVGSLRAGEQPGIGADRLAELIAEVTPRGVLP